MLYRHLTHHQMVQKIIYHVVKEKNGWIKVTAVLMAMMLPKKTSNFIGTILMAVVCAAQPPRGSVRGGRQLPV